MSSSGQKIVGKYLKQAESLQRSGRYEDAVPIYQKYVDQLRRAHQALHKKKGRFDASDQR